MSPSSLRVLAGAAAVLFALLTAIAVGFASRPLQCPAVASGTPTPPPAPPPTSATATSAVVGPGSVGGSVVRTSSGPATSAPASAAVVAQTAPVCTKAAFGAVPAVLALLGAGLAVSVAAGLLLLAGARRGAPAPAHGPAGGRPVRPPAPGPGGGDASARLDADRTALVRACIYVRDRVTSRALADRLATALHDVGVVVVEPVGERFDPSRHEAGGATPAPDPAQVGTIAGVEVPGYSDRGGRVLRAPVVTVYQPANTSQHSTRTRAEEDR